MGEGCNFGFLIGDGSFVVIDKHGKAYIPIEDENSKANYTTSLSSSDSFNGFVTHFFDEMPFSIMKYRQMDLLSLSQMIMTS